MRALPPAGQSDRNPVFFSFLESSEHRLQSEAANALANISAGTSENTCAVIEAGVVKRKRKEKKKKKGKENLETTTKWSRNSLLFSSSSSSSSSSCSSSFSFMCKVPIAARLLASASSDLQDHAAWLLANIVCENCECVLEAGALPPLLNLLDAARHDHQAEHSLIKTGTWLLSNLCQVVFWCCG